MTHLTPGAKALLDGKTVVEIACDAARQGMKVVRPKDTYGDWFAVYEDRLTPLISATITEDGKAREPNPVPLPDPLSPLYYEQRKQYQYAEASRRTWEVDWDIVFSVAPNFKAGKLRQEITPGTPVLGYEKEGKFIIVEVGE